MGRVSLVPLCLAAVVAVWGLSAVAGNAAEYGQCRKLTKATTPKAKHGKYSEGDCLTEYEKKGKTAAKGDYEWYPGPAPSCIAAKKGEYIDSNCTERASKAGKGKFDREPCYPSCAAFTASGGAARLTTEEVTIECKTSDSTGSTEAGTAVVVFTGCELAGLDIPCGNGVSGEIQTSTLEVTLREPSLGGAQLELANAKGANSPYLMRFACESIGAYFEVAGSITAVVKPVNEMDSTADVTVQSESGEQTLLTSVCANSEYTSCPESEQNAPSTLELEETQTNAAPTEVRAALKCGKFPFCEPTITPGVGINTQLHTCTAGPLLIKGKETFLLTAGHCFTAKEVEQKEGTVTTNVESAYPKQAPAEKVIGTKAVVKRNEKYDVAEVEIPEKLGTANNPWLAAQPTPARAALVAWTASWAAKTIVGEAPSNVKDKNCHEGMKGGHKCGEVLQTGISITIPPENPATENPLKLENVVEDSAESQHADSGGPFYIEATGGVKIQGIDVAGGNNRTRVTGNLEQGSKEITFLSPALVPTIKEYKEKWGASNEGVPIEGQNIPAGTHVEKIEVVGQEARVEMSKAASAKCEVESGNPTKCQISFGHKTLAWYEPMKEVLEVFAGQKLLTQATAKRP